MTDIPRGYIYTPLDADMQPVVCEECFASVVNLSRFTDGHRDHHHERKAVSADTEPAFCQATYDLHSGTVEVYRCEYLYRHLPVTRGGTTHDHGAPSRGIWWDASPTVVPEPANPEYAKIMAHLRAAGANHDTYNAVGLAVAMLNTPASDEYREAAVTDWLTQHILHRAAPLDLAINKARESGDPSDWTDAFLMHVKDGKVPDAGTLLSWFANAQAARVDRYQRDHRAEE